MNKLAKTILGSLGLCLSSALAAKPDDVGSPRTFKGQYCNLGTYKLEKFIVSCRESAAFLSSRQDGGIIRYNFPNRDSGPKYFFQRVHISTEHMNPLDRLRQMRDHCDPSLCAKIDLHEISANCDVRMSAGAVWSYWAFEEEIVKVLFAGNILMSYTERDLSIVLDDRSRPAFAVEADVIRDGAQSNFWTSVLSEDRQKKATKLKHRSLAALPSFPSFAAPQVFLQRSQSPGSRWSIVKP